MKTTMKKIAAYLLVLLLVIQLVPAYAYVEGSTYTSPVLTKNSKYLDQLEITSPSGKTVPVGEDLELVTTEGYDKLKWQSSNTSVATVENGVVTGVSAGVVKIKASQEINGKTISDTIVITVVGSSEPSDESESGNSNPDEVSQPARKVTIVINGAKDKLTYDGTEHTYSGFTVTPAEETKNITLVNKEKLIAKKDCGTYIVELTESDFEYKGTADEAELIVSDGWMQIKPASLQIIVDNKTMNEGEEYPSFTAKLNGLKGNDTAESLGLTYTVSEDGTISPVIPDDKIIGNYRVTTVMTGTLTINKKITAKYNGTYLLGMVGVTGDNGKYKNNGLLTSEVITSSKRLKMVPYTESAVSGLIEEPSQLSYWTFEMQPSGNYYISSEGLYLNIKGAAVSMTGTPQELIIEDAGGGKIAIMNSDKYRLNLKSETIKNGVQGSTWNTKDNLPPAFNESFKLYRGVYSNVPEVVEQPLYNMLTMTGDGNYYRLRKTTISTATLYTTLAHATVITDYEMTPYDFTNLVLYDKDNEPYVYSDHELTGEYVSYYTISLQAVKKEDRINQKIAWYNDPTGWLDGSREQYGDEDNETAGYHANYMATLHKGTIPSRSVTITSDWNGGLGYVGLKITLTAHPKGFREGKYTLQWEYSTDGTNWKAQEGATGETFTYELNETTTHYTWRVVAYDMK